MTYQIKVNNGSWETVNKNDIHTAGNTARYMKLGLSKNTAYSFYLRAKNSDEKTSEAVKVIGKTNLPEIAAFGASGLQKSSISSILDDEYNFFSRLTNDNVYSSMNRIRNYYSISAPYSPVQNPTKETVLNTLKNNAEICYISSHGDRVSVTVKGTEDGLHESKLTIDDFNNMPPNSLSHVKLIVLDACLTASTESNKNSNLFSTLTKLHPENLVAFKGSIKSFYAETWCSEFLRQYSENLSNSNDKEYVIKYVDKAIADCNIPAGSGLKSRIVSYKGEIVYD